MHPLDALFNQSKAMSSQAAEVKRLLDEYDFLEPKIRKAFLDAVERLSGSIDVARLAELIRQGQIGSAIALVQESLIAAAMAPFGNTMVAAVLSAAARAADNIPVPKGIQWSIAPGGSNLTNPRTTAFLRSYRFGLIREISDEARKSVAITIREGVNNGINPLQTAKAVKANIGLTAKQTQAVMNYKQALENLSSDALARKLRDKRFDRTVANAIENEVALSKETIDKLVTRYTEKSLKYRAETIARTESIRAVNAGNKAAWQKAVDDGVIPEDRVRRFWIYSRDSKTRPAHRGIPALNPDGVALNEPFKTSLGPLMYPGDPAGAAENTINCRCTQVIRYQARASDG